MVLRSTTGIATARSLAGAVAAVLVWAGSAAAASIVAVQDEGQARGWIGINVERTQAVIQGGRSPGDALYTVSEVVPESGAAAAGIRIGDLILALNGTPATNLAFLALVEQLKVGDPIGVTLLRGDNTLRVRVVAGERPQGLEPQVEVVAMMLDSIRGAAMADFEQRFLRRVEGGATIRVFNTARAEPATADAPQFVLLQPGGGGNSWSFRFETATKPGTTLPFEALVARSPQTDSLFRVIRLLEGRAESLHLAHLVRSEELARVTPLREVQEDEPGDPLLVSLREESARVLDRLESTRGTLVQISRESLASGNVRSGRGTSNGRGATAPRAVSSQPVVGTSWVSTRRIAPYITVDAEYFAGAKITAMNPALGDYFGVNRGVLVTEVVQGTPAAEAGVHSGDVIVGIEGAEITAPGDLPAAVSQGRRPWTLTVVRKGRRLTLSLG